MPLKIDKSKKNQSALGRMKEPGRFDMPLNKETQQPRLGDSLNLARR